MPMLSQLQDSYRSSSTVSLPAEIMVMILVHAIAEEKAAAKAEGRSPHSWMKYLHICGTWRDLLHTVSTIWDDIEATNSEVAEYMLTRGRARNPAVTADFHEHCDVDVGGTGDKVLRVLKKESSHIRSLKLVMPGEMWQCLGQCAVPWTFERLDFLRIEAPMMEGSPTHLPFLAPDLKHLRSEGFVPAAVQQALSPSLRTLAIHCFDFTQMADIMAVLQAVPRVEKLAMMFCLEEDMDDGGIAQMARLPSLTNLDFFIFSTKHIELLASLHYPDSTFQAFHLVPYDWSTSELIEGLSRTANEVIGKHDLCHCTFRTLKPKGLLISFSRLPQVAIAQWPQFSMTLLHYQVEEEAGIMDKLAEYFGPSFAAIENLSFEELAVRSTASLDSWKVLFRAMPRVIKWEVLKEAEANSRATEVLNQMLFDEVRSMVSNRLAGYDSEKDPEEFDE
ncbi:hypothetical protein GLOTRDRAFT_95359 [Gloeophyllum trabeum ATCC 11539]|uniref:F-box domain-containing protein n=1 Tax=Gloeophyllum trabeum (strain ATCC 11539 / FP-39264 / Madison 617) TaxID=670483 RepID=S7PXV0_GLOTA|nr:uncharacterized protein GLOTRDRAFT_95359 [Gloeophyllum trabeum ATCC 11539]EPQ52441.1 hypothetical protein GLOTRDRAFT_95359 [Gloeophyllum trabeum ATCC 11539]